MIAKYSYTYITLVFQVNHNSYIIIIAYLDKDLTFAFFFGYIMFYYLNKHIKFIIIWCKGVTINCRLWYITYDKHIELENTGTLLPFCTRNFWHCGNGFIIYWNSLKDINSIFMKLPRYRSYIHHAMILYLENYVVPLTSNVYTQNL